MKQEVILSSFYFVVLALILANQWITLASVAKYDVIIKEQELKDIYK